MSWNRNILRLPPDSSPQPRAHHSLHISSGSLQAKPACRISPTHASHTTSEGKTIVPSVNVRAKCFPKSFPASVNPVYSIPTRQGTCHLGVGKLELKEKKSNSSQTSSAPTLLKLSMMARGRLCVVTPSEAPKVMAKIIKRK